MITPLEIQNKKFKKTFRGYSEEEVDEFLDDLIIDYESLYLENQELKDSISRTNKDLNRYEEIENTLTETLVIAKTTGEEIIKTAREKSEIIIADSELRAINQHKKAQRQIEKMSEEISRLTIEFNTVRNKYKRFLQTQLDSLGEFDIVDKEILDESEA